MKLEDAVKNAFHDSSFLQSVQTCFGFSSSGGFLSFVDHDGLLFCGNVAPRILPHWEENLSKKQPSFEDYASAARENHERYLACYFSTQGKILDESGFVLLSRWTSFADTVTQEAQLRAHIQAQGLDPDQWMRVTGGFPCIEDFIHLNTLRDCYEQVVFIKGYRLPCKQDLVFTVYQQQEAMELNELKEVIKLDAQDETFLPGLRRLYYRKLIGTWSADSGVYFREETKTRDALISC